MDNFDKSQQHLGAESPGLIDGQVFGDQSSGMAASETTAPQTPADVVERAKEVNKAVSHDSLRTQLDRIQEEGVRHQLSKEDIRVLKRDRVVRAMSGRSIATRTITRLS